MVYVVGSASFYRMCKLGMAREHGRQEWVVGKCTMCGLDKYVHMSPVCTFGG